jgi:hypothetical protein
MGLDGFTVAYILLDYRQIKAIFGKRGKLRKAINISVRLSCRSRK